MQNIKTCSILNYLFCPNSKRGHISPNNTSITQHYLVLGAISGYRYSLFGLRFATSKRAQTGRSIPGAGILECIEI